LDGSALARYNKIRLHGLQGNMNPFMNWTTAMDAATKFAPGTCATVALRRQPCTSSHVRW